MVLEVDVDVNRSSWGIDSRQQVHCARLTTGDRLTVPVYA
jgi:hypothetical protein